MEVLPYFFEKNKKNSDFIAERKQLEQIKQLFMDEMKDDQYARFCRALEDFE